jgi:hypothetical protein
MELSEMETERLHRQARAKGIDEATLLHPLIADLPEEAGLPQTEAEWEALEAELSEGLENVPPLSEEANSRAACYPVRI